MKGKNFAAITLGTILGLGGMNAAQAGLYQDDLSRCLVNSTTDQQKTVMIEWLFSFIALHPLVKPMTSITDAQRDQLNKSAGDMIMSLFTNSCRKQAQDAVKYEGGAAIQGSFAVLGQVAMRDLLTNPDVQKGMESMKQYFDESKLKTVLESQAPPAGTAAPAAGSGGH